LPVTLDAIAYHCRAVARGARRAHLVGDMPFMSFQASIEQGITNAGKLMKEGACHSIKLYHATALWVPASPEEQRAQLYSLHGIHLHELHGHAPLGRQPM
jgi:hypothetical protein